MAELEKNGQPVGGLPVSDPQAGLIQEQNARRLARRRQAAALALDVARVSGENLSRQGETRKVGGTFEALQAVPPPTTPTRAGLTLADLTAFLGAANFTAQQKTLGVNQFLSSFGPSILGLTTTGAA